LREREEAEKKQEELTRQAAAAHKEAQEEAAKLLREKEESEKKQEELARQAAAVRKKAQEEAAKFLRERKESETKQEELERQAAAANRKAQEAQDEQTRLVAEVQKNLERQIAEANKRAQEALEEKTRLEEKLQKLKGPNRLYVPYAQYGMGWVQGMYTITNKVSEDGYPIWEQQTATSYTSWLPAGGYYRLYSDDGRWRFEPPNEKLYLEHRGYTDNKKHNGRWPHETVFHCEDWELNIKTQQD